MYSGGHCNTAQVASMAVWYRTSRRNLTPLKLQEVQKLHQILLQALRHAGKSIYLAECVCAIPSKDVAYAPATHHTSSHHYQVQRRRQQRRKLSYLKARAHVRRSVPPWRARAKLQTGLVTPRAASNTIKALADVQTSDEYQCENMYYWCYFAIHLTES